MVTQLLWGTRQPAVVLSDEEHLLKRMYHVRFADGSIDSSNSGPDGDAEIDGMYLYVVCKTNLTNESISITYVGTDDVTYTIPVTGGLDLSLKTKGDIVRITNAIDLQTIAVVETKSITSVNWISGGIAGQELEIWGIDTDETFMSLKQPPPFEPQFEPVRKVNTLISGSEDTKLQGFRLNATLSYEKLTTEEAKPFLDIFNYGNPFYLYPHFVEAPAIKFKVYWQNNFIFNHWYNKRRFYAVPEIIFRGVDLIKPDELPKALDPPTDHTGYWSSPYARVDNDDARFWDGVEPWIKGDLIFNAKKAFAIQYSGTQADCPLVISKSHLETHPGGTTDINIGLSRQLVNLLIDGNMELPHCDSWTIGGTGAISKDSNNVKFGRRSLKFVGIAAQDNFYQDLSVTGGDNVHYELWVYKSSTSTSVVSVECYNVTDGVYIFADIDAPSNNTWCKLTIDAKIGGTGTKTIRIRFRQVGAGSTLYWFDNLWLLENKVDNGGLEGTYVGGVAPGWTKNGSPTCQSSTAKNTGTYAQSITASTSSANSVSQVISGLVVGQIYTLKGHLRKYSGTGNVIAELTGAGAKVLSSNSASYVREDFTFKAGSTSATITLYCDNAGVVGLFDDFSILVACPETMAELLKMIDDWVDYSAIAQIDETDFDLTTERHYNAEAGADLLQKIEVTDIKASPVTLNW